MSEFERYHPLINFIFFVIVIGLTMFFMHPFYLFLSLLISFTYLFEKDGKKALVYGAKLLPLALVAVVINVLFNHRGSTILMYFQNGNPLTKESIYFGVCASMMLLASVFWFRLFHEVMTSDKLIYIFGRTFPKISLLLSMIFRFVPRMVRELKEIHDGQKALGIYQSEKGLKKIKCLCDVLLTEMTLAFENSIEISMSMKMRGYREQKRSYFSMFHLKKKDIIFLISTIVLLIGTLVEINQGHLYYRFYPTFQVNRCGMLEAVGLGIYGILLLLPLIIEIREKIRWERLQSKI